MDCTAKYFQGSDSNAVGFTLSIKPRGGGGVGNMVQNTGDWISGTATNYTKMILTLDASAVTSGQSLSSFLNHSSISVFTCMAQSGSVFAR